MPELCLRDGAMPILLTAFDEDDRLDLAAIGAMLGFYAALDLPGVLALGQASEMLLLDDEERRQVAQFVAQQPRGTMRLATVGNFGATLDQQARSLQRIFEQGTDVVVVALSLLPSADNLGAQLQEIARLLPAHVRLGIYELPEPEHRLLTPAEVGEVAASGRFFFMKETSRQLESFRAKIAASAGSPLKIYQANLRMLPASMEAGGCGFCGWMPIVAPELCAQVCDLSLPAEVRVAAQEALLSFYDVMVAQGFPASAKHILSLRGLSLNPYSRAPAAQIFFQRDTSELDDYIARENPFAGISFVRES
ncbi:MAG: dihydrodipicolinate synthase family protein [Chloroflexi bacterium]|nr:dihydrodipicolinate synthase family protein [Chloroflexota bacterium]